MSDTASDLASGSQDLAALLGLFCTDGVERNALAYNFGWGTVVASSLSLLGVLGLVKSSIKLALGLRYCQQAGFNLDSLRGIFGYLPGESPATGRVVECSVIQVELSPSQMSITKTRRYVYSIPLRIVPNTIRVQDKKKFCGRWRKAPSRMPLSHFLQSMLEAIG